MAEFAGLGYYVEIPGVIWDVQRVGPSTGLPTRTAQGDISFVAKLSHGDTKHPMLLPSSPAECFTMAGEAFDLAEQLQSPVFVMSDLDLGMNNWMSDAFVYPEKPMNRGKVLTRGRLVRPEALRATKMSTAMRFRIALCRAPIIRAPRGLRVAADTTRRVSTASVPTTTPTTWTAWRASSRPRARWCRVRKWCATTAMRSASSPMARRITRVVETLDQLQNEYGVHADYLRLRAYPFTRGDARLHRRAQAGLRRRPEPRRPDARADEARHRHAEEIVKLRSVRHYNGLPIDARSITDEIISQEGK